MGSKTDVVVKLVLVFFVTLLSFSIGTFVGKKYSDNQHQLAQLEPNGGQRNVASEEHATGHETPAQGTMSDEEIAKLAEEFVSDDTEKPAGDAHATQEHGAPANKAHGANHESTPVAPAAADSASHNAASPVAQDIAAGNTKNIENMVSAKTATAQERIPSSLPKNVAQYTVGKFTVQIASFADEADAQKTAADLKQKGYSAFYVPANVSGKTRYRVSIGQFATSKEAQVYQAEFLNSNKGMTAIVQKITE